MERAMRHSVLASVLVSAVSAGASVALAGAQASPAAPAGTASAAGQGGRGGGGRLGGGGFAAPTKAPSELRAIPAETTAAKVKDPSWKAPRLAWGHPDLEGIWTSDDMRGIPTSRPPAQASRESLTPEEFARRAGGDEASRDRAVNEETFLRNEFGVRTFGYTSFVVEPADGRLPGLTQAGLAKQKASFGIGTFGTRPFNSFEDFSLYDRCITRGVGGVFPVLYGNGLRIVQTPDAVVISYEMVHDTRVIPLDGRATVGPAIKQYMGSARGHFEADTLVVETTSFTDRIGFQGPNSEGLKLTERFTRIDPQMIDYRIRVDDPAMYTAPFTMRFTITAQPNYQMYEYSCHEGNSAVGNALSGERAYERLVAEAKAKGQPIPPRTVGMEVYSGQAVEGVQPVREIGFGK